MRLGFYQPDIPQNLGAAIRLSACFDVPLDIVEPCGFPLTERALRRSAMDYGANAHIQRFSGWSTFRETSLSEGQRIVLFSTKGATPLHKFSFHPGDRLLFGRESAGVPDEVAGAVDARVLIPMAAGLRSLNVVISAGIGLWEALRQTRL